METAKDILAKHINGCSCDEAYTKRNLTAPDCFWCNESDQIVEAMQEYVSVCLEAADRKRGQLEREVEYLRESESRRNNWLSKAKREAGYDQNTSFDVVWSETLKKIHPAT